MSFRLTSDPSESIRKLEKGLLMLRFVWWFPRRTVVYVGVNHGQFLHLAARLWPDADIVGIEPNARIADEVAAAYAGNPNIRMETCAVGAEAGEIELFVTRDDQNSSIRRPTDAFEEERSGDGVVGTEKVPLKRMDGLLEGCAGPMLMKIDVQGAEMEVLRGTGDRLDDVEVMLIEAPFEKAYEGAAGFDEIYRFLTDRGFAYEGAMGQLNSRRTGRVRQEDSIYVRRAVTR